MYNNDAQRCLTGEVLLSYVNLDKPRQPQGGVGDAKYSATLLIPKTDTATIGRFPCRYSGGSANRRGDAVGRYHPAESGFHHPRRRRCTPQRHPVWR